MKTLSNTLSDRSNLSSSKRRSSYLTEIHDIIKFTARLLLAARYFPVLNIYNICVCVCVCVRVYINTAIIHLTEVAVVTVSICNLFGILKLRLSEKPATCSKLSSRRALSNSHMAGLSQERSLP